MTERILRRLILEQIELIDFSDKPKGNDVDEDPNFERAHLYAYLIQLYKAVYLNKVNKEVCC